MFALVAWLNRQCRGFVGQGTAVLLRRVAILLGLLALAAHAQTVVGVVTDAGNHPIAGVVVLLVDSASHVEARALSDSVGAFLLSAGRPGSYRLRTLRIGFRPTSSDPVTLVRGGQVTRRLVLTGVPVALDAMRVADHAVCRAFADSGAAPYAVWEQIRTALSAAQLTQVSNTITATTVSYRRWLAPGSEHVLAQRATVSTDYVARPWRTPTPDSLRQFGYVVTRPDNTVDYYAPGIDMLLSDAFVEDHCFRLTADRDRPAIVGLSFEPTPERTKRVAEIAGTMWVDRASSELRRLDLRYVNLPSDQAESAGAGVEFVRMRDGAWTVGDWSIQMPMHQVVLSPYGAEHRLTGIQVVGGNLVVARRGTDTLWSQRPGALAGSVLDSSSGSPVRGARIAFVGAAREATSDARGQFTVEQILPGVYAVDVRTASLDSLNLNIGHRLSLTVTSVAEPVRIRVPNARQVAAAICGSSRGADDERTGIVVGHVRLDDSSGAPAPPNARVTGEWPADSGHVRRLEAAVADDGAFRLCRLPIGSAIGLRAAAAGVASAEPTLVRLLPTSRLSTVDLTVVSSEKLAKRGATFIGVVVFDSTRAPIVGAEVALPELGKSAVTDAKGHFVLTGISAGDHQILIRRLGYGPAETRLLFQGDSTIERQIVLGRAVTLEPVVISEHAIDRAMASFEENRRLGLGHFLTRADLAKMEGVSVGAILETLPGAEIIHGRSGAWIRSSRVFGRIQAVPDEADQLAGAPAVTCYAQVYLDNALVFSGLPTFKRWPPLFNLNSLSLSAVEAMEFYASPAETPLQYARMESYCGVLVIWTRRSP